MTTLSEMQKMAEWAESMSKRLILPPIQKIETEEQAQKMRDKSGINWKVGDEYFTMKRYISY